MSHRHRFSGFTLLELLVVLAIIALVSAAVTLGVRPSSERQLDREAERLVALLESARHQSQVQGAAVIWQPTEAGFAFSGLTTAPLPNQWLSSPAPQVSGQSVLILGPEPIVPAQTLSLSYAVESGTDVRKLDIYTDGLAPFQIRAAQP